jgi:hypothetical protein
MAGAILALPGCDPVISDAAKKRFQNRTGPFSVTVFPVNITSGARVRHDAEMAERLADFLRHQHLAKPVISSRNIDMPAYYGFSDTKRIRLSVRHLREVIRETDLSTGYVLMTEIVLNRQETRVVGVYFYLSDRFGRIASARMADSHHLDFQRIKPQSRNDAFRVLKAMIRETWQPA